MNPPTFDQACRILRERLDARDTGLAPYAREYIYCPICELNYTDATAGSHVKFHRQRRLQPSEPFAFWNGLSRFTHWIAIPDSHAAIPASYPRENVPGFSATHYLVQGRAASWILRNRALLRRAGVGVHHRGGVYLLPDLVWHFICALAVHLTFEEDAFAIYTEAAARLSAATADPADCQDASSQVAGGQASVPAL